MEPVHLDLVAHTACPPLCVTAISASLRVEGNWLLARWRIDGAGAMFAPPFAGRGRADGLWQTTCFELFLQPLGEAGYIELNLSPSERWAAYAFRAPREGCTDRPLARDPVCTLRRGGQVAIFEAAIPLGSLPPISWACGVTVVLEERAPQSGEPVKSYWALAHGKASPDFHDPACFTARLEAGEGA